MQRTIATCVTTMLWLGACAAEAPAPTVMESLTSSVREQLFQLGIEDLEREGDLVRLLRGGEVIGEVRMAEDGYDVELEGAAAQLRQNAGGLTWSCADGRAGSTSETSVGLRELVEADPTLPATPCALSLAAGWFVSGALKEPPAGCERVIIEGEARIRCGEAIAAEPGEFGRSESALLQECGYDPFEDFDLDGSCMDSGWGCSPWPWAWLSGKMKVPWTRLIVPRLPRA